MSKHSKNNCAAPTMTRKERDKLKGVWGTSELRLGADSFKDFDACGICLHAADDPLVCHKGHLYCKVCIFEALLTQREHKKRAMAKYEEQLAALANEQKKAEAAREAREAARFAALESGILPSGHVFGERAELAPELVPDGYEAYRTGEGRVYLVDRDAARLYASGEADLTPQQREQRKRALPCYWIPALTPETKTTLVAKPAGHTVCPTGSHPLRLKQLAPVRFTPDAGRASGSHTQRRVIGRWMCASCRSALTNASKMACLRTCGHVVCLTCVTEFVDKDRHCPSCAAEVRDKDVVRLEGGRTGFAAGGARVATIQLTPGFQG